MSYFLFVDESGHDRKLSPAEVLGGFVIRDGTLWAFIQAALELQTELFGISYPDLNAMRRAGLEISTEEEPDWKEIKGDVFLNPRVFKKAAWFPAIPKDERRRLTHASLLDGATADKRSLSALAQAKLEYVRALFELCLKFKGGGFGIIVPQDAPGERKISVLRKDYAYLFERFYYFVDSKSKEHAGIIVFDELDKSASHILLGQMQAYYRDFRKGRDRAERLVPEPFFVHSDLTVGIQVADLIAYVLNWGHRFDRNTIVPRYRPELLPYLQQVKEMQIDSFVGGNKTEGVYVVYDLRTKQERKGNADKPAKPS